jgi:superfamily II DNA/RNA helicase
VQFIQDIFDSASSLTQSIVFVNNRSFAVTVHRILRDAGYKASLIMGGQMETWERDEQIELFRKGKIAMVITTDLLSRGFDMPTISLAINFDVPQSKGVAEHETYLHRIGRAGRFGMPGIAITLFDRPDDEAVFWETIDHYKMRDRVTELTGGAEQVGKLLDGLKE